VDLDRDYQPDFQPFKRLLVDMAQERSVDALLSMIVNRLAEQPHLALARIWLMQPGDICDSCRMRQECPDQTSCLHLVASAGCSLTERVPAWTRVDGDFRRFPLGVRKVGRIGATGEPVEVRDIEEEGGSWIAQPEWARREGIVGFGGQPLIHKGKVLGVLAVFARTRMLDEGLIWLRMIADHAATAIANARAFEEIERLRRQLELENEYLREEVKVAHALGDIVGQSSALGKVLEQVALVAPTDTSVLILGESGTGKELVARAIHERSYRRDHAMVKVNCASIPRELFESEFFGHVKGAFTGAVRDRVGRFQLADRGTLFLDEVGEIPLELQGKLLRVLQEGAFERVGEERTRTVDVRIIAATNRDLKQEVDAKRFRQDLYYRLSVFPVEVMPLRERVEDIPLLAAHFLSQACGRLGVPEIRLKRRHVQMLQEYNWPGNIRELQNVIERAVITARSGKLQLDLPKSSLRTSSFEVVSPAGSQPTTEILNYAELDRRERANLLAALQLTNWKVSGRGGAAKLLGVKSTTLASRMKAMGIERPG
jgi:transcriptional regulator with GAF, ATPase, and Fis domain